MSDNKPLEIQKEIVERIGEIKWVIQYRSVSKLWKSVIDSKEFVTAHTRRHSHDDNHRLLVEKESAKKVEYLISIVDDDSFPRRRRKLSVPFPVKKIGKRGRIIVDGCHGLICLIKRHIAVVWNPSIRKAVAIKVPKLYKKNHNIIIGFGVCRSTLDPKLVKITHVYLGLHDHVITSTHVEVFTLGSGGTWRSPLSSNFPHKSIEIVGDSHAVVNGLLYLNAVVDRIFVGWEVVSTNHRNLIMSFDFTSEEFTQVNLPDHLALDPYAPFSL